VNRGQSGIVAWSPNPVRGGHKEIAGMYSDVRTRMHTDRLPLQYTTFNLPLSHDRKSFSTAESTNELFPWYTSGS
jgi:hypothetical protein